MTNISNVHANNNTNTNTNTNRTCGIFLVDAKKRAILVCHATNSPWNSWGIPKGLAEPGEEFIDTAIREFQEETGLRLEKSQVTYLGTVDYKTGPKKLVAFWAKTDDIDTVIDVKALKCISMVKEAGKEPFPEVDKYKWIDLDSPEQVKTLYYPQRQMIDLLNCTLSRASGH